MNSYTKKYIFYILLFLANVLTCRAAFSEINNAEEYSVIAGVIIENSSVFSSEDLLPSYFELIGTAATNEKLSELQTNIFNAYTKNGYYSPYVTISSHSEFKNIFLVSIEEPLLLAFKIEGGWGDARIKASNYLNSLLGSNFVDERAFEYLENALEHRLGIGVEISHSELDKNNFGFDVLVNLTGDVNARVSFSNTGNNNLSRETIFAEVQLVQQVPGFNTIYLNTFNSLDGDAYRSLGLGFNFELNPKNELRFSTNKSRVRYEQLGQPSDLIYTVKRTSLEWQLQLMETQTLAKYFFTSLSGRSLQRENIAVDIEEILRVVNLGYWQQSLGKNSSTYWSMAMAKGFDSLGAKLEGSAVNTDIELDFSKYSARLVFNQDLSENVSFNLAVSAQYSSDYLPFSERFVIASNSIAPAYESGEWSGDSGLGFKVEIARGVNLSLLSSRWVPYAYYGAGKARNNSQGNSTSVASLGLGVRWFNNMMTLYCELGKPLIEDSAYRGSHPRLAAGLTLWF